MWKTCHNFLPWASVLDTWPCTLDDVQHDNNASTELSRIRECRLNMSFFVCFHDILKKNILPLSCATKRVETESFSELVPKQSKLIHKGTTPLKCNMLQTAISTRGVSCSKHCLNTLWLAAQSVSASTLKISNT